MKTVELISHDINSAVKSYGETKDLHSLRQTLYSAIQDIKPHLVDKNNLDDFVILAEQDSLNREVTTKQDVTDIIHGVTSLLSHISE